MNRKITSALLAIALTLGCGVVALSAPVKLQCTLVEDKSVTFPLDVDLDKRTIQLNSNRYEITQVSPKYITGLSGSSTGPDEANKDIYAGRSGGETIVIERSNGTTYRSSISCSINGPAKDITDFDKCAITILSQIAICKSGVL